VSESNLKEFLSGWRDNRVRVLMFDNRKQPCLRYLAAAFSFREHAVAGYFNTARLVHSLYRAFLSKLQMNLPQSLVVFYRCLLSHSYCQKQMCRCSCDHCCHQYYCHFCHYLFIYFM